MGCKTRHWCKNPIKNKHYADYRSVVFTSRNEPKYECSVCGRKYTTFDLEIRSKAGHYIPKRVIPSIKQLTKMVNRKLFKQ